MQIQASEVGFWTSSALTSAGVNAEKSLLLDVEGGRYWEGWFSSQIHHTNQWTTPPLYELILFVEELRGLGREVGVCICCFSIGKVVQPPGPCFFITLVVKLWGEVHAFVAPLSVCF